MTATILVVDDNEQNIKLLEAKLVSEYYTVLTAENARGAIEILKKNKVDIILLDVMMPEMDGFTACREIKSNKDTAHIPIVIVTALHGVDDRVKGLEAGADELLTKPIDDVALFARVKSLARMKAAMDELTLRNSAITELGGKTIKLKTSFANNKILLLDDDLIQAKNIKSKLTSLTQQIQIISSAADIAGLGSFVPDLVIISCQLSDQDPLRISAMLRAKPSFKNIVLMLLSEEENISIVIKGMEIGINDYFVYPVTKEELQARIRTQLRRKQYQDDLRLELEENIDLSTKDGLTGVFNRRYFDIHIKHLVQLAQNSRHDICMMMFDLDDFKKVNDTYGHQAGDAILREFSKSLKSSFRATDLVARYGGEEFIVLLSDVGIKKATQIAEKTRAAIAKIDFTIPGETKTLKQFTSIGVAKFNPNDSIESFIRRVDKALYNAKESGKNCVIAG
ncbi:MAG: PleD family two-component system response regulator [Rickettsiales bacterium]|nr:MAG: PleD family two-component system response regulator [Rickettsiales bacterium]